MPRWLIAGLMSLVAACRSGGSGRGLTLVDDARVAATMTGPARRIVSLIPAATELLFALGAGPAVVGRTRWCDFPLEASQVPSVGDGLQPNVEAIIARRPDLVVAYRSPANQAAVVRLRGLGLPVLELAIDRLSDFARDARLLARAVGRSAAGDSLVAATDSAVARVTVHVEHPPTVLIVAWENPPYTIGGGSYLSEIIDRAGGTNLFADQARPSFPVSIEAVSRRNPDLVLVVGEGEPAIAARPEWQVVPAVRARRFVRISGSEFERPSPRIAHAVELLAAKLRRTGPE